MRRVPVAMDRETLLAHLDAIRAGVASGDSLEGNIEWSLPTEEDVPVGSFMVQGAYRVGNLMGQGGMQMVGEWVDE